MFVLLHGSKVYGPFYTDEAAKEYAVDRFGGGGKVEPLSPLDVMPRPSAGIEIPIETAIEQINAIVNATPLLVVKILTVQDILNYDECEADSTGVQLTAECIRATVGWRDWYLQNDLDGEEVYQIACDARKILEAQTRTQPD